ncbi:MAG: helix-turn-helix domain-containing protein [Steroidobacteraceae bacterium]
MAERSIKSAMRTLAVFEFFALEQRALRVRDVSTALSIPQSSASMLLENLVDLGYLEHDRRARTFIPTIRVALLGTWIHHKFAQDMQLERRLDELQSAVGEMVYIGIENRWRAQYVLVQYPTSPRRFEVHGGQFRTLTRSAMGHVLLSRKPDAEVLKLVRRTNAEEPDPKLRVSETAFMDLIAKVRVQGFSETLGASTPGLGAFAITTLNPTSTTPIAVGVAGPIHRMREKRSLILSELKQFMLEFDSGSTPPLI